MSLFQAADFVVFHLNKPPLHFVLKVGFYVSKTLLESLVVVQTQPFFLNSKPPVVFLMKLGFNGRFDVGFSLLKSLMLFNAVLFVKGVDLTLKSQIQLLTDACFFRC